MSRDLLGSCLRNSSDFVQGRRLCLPAALARIDGAVDGEAHVGNVAHDHTHVEAALDAIADGTLPDQQSSAHTADGLISKHTDLGRGKASSCARTQPKLPQALSYALHSMHRSTFTSASALRSRKAEGKSPRRRPWRWAVWTRRWRLPGRLWPPTRPWRRPGQ